MRWMRERNGGVYTATAAREFISAPRNRQAALVWLCGAGRSDCRSALREVVAGALRSIRGEVCVTGLRQEVVMASSAVERFGWRNRFCFSMGNQKSTWNANAQDEGEGRRSWRRKHCMSKDFRV
jgi:hypothetical protein